MLFYFCKRFAFSNTVKFNIRKALNLGDDVFIKKFYSLTNYKIYSSLQNIFQTQFLNYIVHSNEARKYK